MQQTENEFIVALAGSPNVGKSTIFNALTGLKQHTGNWTGKTVETAQGEFTLELEAPAMPIRGGSGSHGFQHHTRRQRTANAKGAEGKEPALELGRKPPRIGSTKKNAGERSPRRTARVKLVDLPGCYSLVPCSGEEAVARDFIENGGADAVIVVADALCLKRCLMLTLQIMELTRNIVLCVNLVDEAEKKGVTIDAALLAGRLGLPVVLCAGRSGRGLPELKLALARMLLSHSPKASEPDATIHRADTVPYKPNAVYPAADGSRPDAYLPDEYCREVGKLTEGVILPRRPEENCCGDCRRCINRDAAAATKEARASLLDRLLTNRITAFPIMLLMLLFIFYLTIEGANKPSELLASGFSILGGWLDSLFRMLNLPDLLRGALIDGIYGTLSRVVAVMLPPMAIFFPLFTLAEDFGLLPRLAFNLDGCFTRCHGCGKQALTMCMGFGCNAVGVTGCRIIPGKRERLIAILTNSLVPCNGRFPLLIAIISLFFASGAGFLSGFASAAILALAIALSVLMTLLVSRILGDTLLRGESAPFILELPPYRAPRIGQVIVRSILDRTLRILGRAAMVAAPAGLIIFLLANTNIGGASIAAHICDILDPLGRFMGLDGTILAAFLLSLPANELTLPLVGMLYISGAGFSDVSLSALSGLFAANGWTACTAICFLIFTLFHWPCSTTVLTIKKETGSVKWTILAILLPTAVGIALCAAVRALWG